MISNERLNDAEEEILKILKAEEGLFWREVQLELQAHYEEIPIWILLFEDSDLHESHFRLAEILKPWMEVIAPVQFRVSYTILKGPLEITLETAMSNDEILEGLNSLDFGKYPQVSERSELTMFDSKDSGLRPR